MMAETTVDPWPNRELYHIACQERDQLAKQLEAERLWRKRAATLLLALSGDGLAVASAPTKALIRKLLAD